MKRSSLALTCAVAAMCAGPTALGDGAIVDTKKDGGTCSVSFNVGPQVVTEYTGLAHQVFTPSGNDHYMCNLRLVSGEPRRDTLTTPDFVIELRGQSGIWRSYRKNEL